MNMYNGFMLSRSVSQRECRKRGCVDYLEKEEKGPRTRGPRSTSSSIDDSQFVN